MGRITEAITRTFLRGKPPKAAPVVNVDGAIILQEWAAFWADFRNDEMAVEMQSCKIDAAPLAERLGQVPPGQQPSPELLADLLTLLLRLRRERHQALSQRLDDIVANHQQATGRIQAMSLAEAKGTDDQERIRRRLRLVLERLGDNPPNDESLPALLERLLKASKLPLEVRRSGRQKALSGRHRV